MSAIIKEDTVGKAYIPYIYTWNTQNPEFENCIMEKKSLEPVIGLDLNKFIKIVSKSGFGIGTEGFEFKIFNGGAYYFPFYGTTYCNIKLLGFDDPEITVEELSLIHI